MKIIKLHPECLDKSAVAPTLTPNGWVYVVCNVFKMGATKLAIARLRDKYYLPFDLLSGFQISDDTFQGEKGLHELAMTAEKYSLIVNNEPTKSMDKMIKEKMLKDAIDKYGEKPPIIWIDDNEEGKKIVDKLVTGKAVNNNA